MSFEHTPEILKEQNETIGQELAQQYAEYIGEDGTKPQEPQPTDSLKDNDGEEPRKPFTNRSNRTPEEIEAQKETDSRSVYVGNVDYKATPEELDAYFAQAGNINRITILFDRFTGYPKGYAYVEFESQSSVENAIGLSGSEFKDRTISVTVKRTNVPGFKRGGRGRGRGSFRGRGGNGFRGDRGGSFRGRGNYRGRGNGRGGFRGDSNAGEQQSDDLGAELLAN